MVALGERLEVGEHVREREVASLSLPMGLENDLGCPLFVALHLHNPAARAARKSALQSRGGGETC